MRPLHKDDMMKLSSTPMAVNGKTPTASAPGISRRYADLDGGIWRGIWLVRVGALITCALNPSQLPASEKGREMTNQSSTSTSIVPNGTAPDAPRAQTKRLRKKKVANTNAGRHTGV